MLHAGREQGRLRQAAPQSLQHRPPRVQRRSLHVCASVRARWRLDVRYGCKADATALLQEWVGSVGAAAGLQPQHVRLSSGAIGVPESRLELEASFNSVADWEAFLGRIPAAQHRAWSQRVASMVVDGSPVWEVHRSIAVPAWSGAPTAAAAAADSTQPSSWGAAAGAKQQPPQQQQKQQQLVMTDEITLDDLAAWEQLKRGSSRELEPSTPPAGSGDADDPQQQQQQEERVALDWKGDPIKFNPGDKLPFKFL